MKWENDIEDMPLVPIEAPPPPPPQYQDGACSICLDAKCQVVDISKCKQNHVACIKCLEAYYLQKDLELYPLHCFACTQYVSVLQLQRNQVITTPVQTKMVQKFRHLEKKQRQPDKWVFFSCPHCDITKSVRKTSQSMVHTCTSCKKEFMGTLNKEIMEIAEVLTSLQSDNMGINDGWGRCPNCNFVVSKGSGCNHMRCTYCKHSFTWASNTQPIETTVQSFVDQELRNI